MIFKDNIKCIRYEACPVSGFSIGKLVLISNCENVIKNGFGLYVPAFMKTINHGVVFNDWKKGKLQNTNKTLYFS